MRKIKKLKQNALLSVAASICLAASVLYAADPAVITIQSKNLFPESVTSTKDGAVIIGSWGTNTIWRVPAGTSNAAKWIDVINATRTIRNDKGPFRLFPVSLSK